jgi:hypothetical protein
MKKQYVVTIRDGYGEAFTKIMTAPEIFDRMDMDDCTGEYITDLRLIKPNNKNPLVRAEFHGTWHDLRRPLLMTITVRGKVVDSGYGTDH